MSPPEPVRIGDGPPPPEVRVDLLVAHTSSAARAAAERSLGLDDLVARAVAAANAAHALSRTGVRLETVGRLEIPDPEEPSSVGALESLRDLETLRAARDRAAADLVSVIGGSHLDALGKAWIMERPDERFADYAYSLVRVDGLWRGTMTLAHETAHCFGADHDVDHVEGDDRSGRAHAWSLEVAGRSHRTLLSMQGGALLPHFSSPLLRYDGVPAGRPDTADNAAVIRENAALVAGFR